jgi:hypothetical protein
VQHLGANAIEHCEADIGAILRGIDVNAKRSLSELGVDNIHDRLGDGAGVGIGRDDGRKCLLDLLAEAVYGPASYLAARPASAGRLALAKWSVPDVKAPGTIVEVSMPRRDSSRAYCTAMASIAAFAAKQGAR